MMQLSVGGRTYSVRKGEMLVGSGPGVAIPLFGEGVAPRHAIVESWPDGSAVIRPLDDAVVTVNGVRLGADPAPLLHGDKLQVGQHEVIVVDEERSGVTRHMRAIADSGRPEGSLVSLTDGREYPVDDAPLVFGRDATADVVVEGSDVSRRHAEIMRVGDDFRLLDRSANGTFVNANPVHGEHRLIRGDVIRIGSEEFRFHSNERAPAPAPGAQHRLNDTMFGMPAFEAPPMPRSSNAAPLASVLFRSGPQKGERVSLRVPVVNVGRAEYNDLRIDDPSVSTMHAKLQLRSGLWQLTDLGSTNGTFADGVLVSGEVVLGPGATLKFGEVAVLFDPVDREEPADGPPTRVMEGLVVPTPVGTDGITRRAEPEVVERRSFTSRATKVAPPPPKRTGRWLAIAVILASAAAAAYLLLMR